MAYRLALLYEFICSPNSIYFFAKIINVTLWELWIGGIL